MRAVMLAFGAAVAVMAASTLLMVLDPDVPFSVRSTPLDVVVNDTALLVGLALAWLALLRHQQDGDFGSAAVGAAFVVAAGLNLLVITVQAGGLDRQIGMSPSAPTSEPLFLHTGIRSVAAGTLLLGGIGVRAGWRFQNAGRLVALALAVAVAVGIIIHVGWQLLPPWIDEAALRREMAGGVSAGPIDGVMPIALVIQGLLALTFLVAALLFVRWQPPSHSPIAVYLVVALVIGAAAEVHYALFPGSFSGVVSSSDLLRLLFASTLLVGMAADLRASSRALVAAESEVERLRDADVARATLEERARLAREIHDGLSQHLWLAKLRLERIEAAVRGGTVEDEVRHIADLVDTGLGEAEQTIAALRLPAAGSGLLEALESFARSTSSHSGVRIQLSTTGPVDDLPARVQAECLRVVQEAVNNAVRHADATLINVRIDCDATSLTLQVHDNGNGFSPEAVQEGFGLTGMRERVMGIGGTLTISSAESDGTSIGVEVPIGA